MPTSAGASPSTWLLRSVPEGSAVATVASFTANLVVAVTFLTQLENLTPSGTYGLYLGFIIIGLVLAYYCYPETKGLSVDEAFSLFEDGFGVNKSQEMRREKMEAQARYNDHENGLANALREGDAGKQDIHHLEEVEKL